MIDSDKKCRHFTGLMNKTCAVGIKYDAVKFDSIRNLPCFAIGGECASYSPYTAEELKAQADERQHFVESIKKGISPCCDAPINESHVIPDGRFRGHGKRFCSKCGKLLFNVASFYLWSEFL